MGLPQDGPCGHSQDPSRFSMDLRHGDSTDMSDRHVEIDMTSL